MKYILTDCLICILPHGSPGYLIDYPEDAKDINGYQLLQSSDLEILLDNIEKLPKEKGIYGCELHIEVTPTDYDEDSIVIEAKGFEKMVLKTEREVEWEYFNSNDRYRMR